MKRALRTAGLVLATLPALACRSAPIAPDDASHPDERVVALMNTQTLARLSDLAAEPAASDPSDGSEPVLSPAQRTAIVGDLERCLSRDFVTATSAARRVV